MTIQPRSVFLASRSPRRRELLRQIGLSFEVIPLREAPGRKPDVDETPRAGESADDYVLRVATEKAEAAANMAVARRIPPRPVLAADTTVVCDGRILGKPEDSAAAARMLAQLSGREHRVLTAVVVSDAGVLKSRVSDSRVWFRALDDEDIKRYLLAGESMDKAGAYAIQGRAAAFITRIDGSYSGIMGLPLAETADLLGECGITLP